MVCVSGGAPTHPNWLFYGLREGKTARLEIVFNANVKYTLDGVRVYILHFLSSIFVSFMSANPPDLVVSGQAQYLNDLEQKGNIYIKMLVGLYLLICFATSCKCIFKKTLFSDLVNSLMDHPGKLNNQHF